MPLDLSKMSDEELKQYEQTIVARGQSKAPSYSNSSDEDLRRRERYLEQRMNAPSPTSKPASKEVDGDLSRRLPSPTDDSTSGPLSFPQAQMKDPVSKRVTEDIKQGRAKVLKSEMHPDLQYSDRFYIKNLIWHDPEKALETLRSKDSPYKDYEFAIQDGDIVMRKFDELDFRPIDPSGGLSTITDLPADIADVGWDVVADTATGLAATAGGLAGAAATPATPPIGMVAGASAAGGAAGAGMESLRQGLANYLEGAQYDPSMIGIAGAAGALSGPLGGFLPGDAALAKRGMTAAEIAALRESTSVAGKLGAKLEARSLRKLAERTGVPEDVWQAVPDKKRLLESWKESKFERGAMKEAYDQAKQMVEISPNDPLVRSEAERLIADAGARLGPGKTLVSKAKRELEVADRTIRKVGEEIGQGVRNASTRYQSQHDAPLLIQTDDIVQSLKDDMAEQLKKDISSQARADTQAAYEKVIKEFERPDWDKVKGSFDIPESLTPETAAQLPSQYYKNVDIESAHHTVQRLADLSNFYKQAPKATGAAQKDKALQAKTSEIAAKKAWDMLNQRVQESLPPEAQLARKQYHELKTARKYVGDLLKNESSAFNFMRNAKDSVNSTTREAFEQLDMMTNSDLMGGPVLEAQMYKYLVEPSKFGYTPAGITSTTKKIDESILGPGMGGLVGYQLDTALGTNLMPGAPGLFTMGGLAGGRAIQNVRQSPAANLKLMQMTQPFKEGYGAATDLLPFSPTGAATVGPLRSGWELLQEQQDGRNNRGRRSP